MKKARYLLLIGTAAALFAAKSASAQSYTYEFTADTGYTTAFDGSTVTISDGSITDWDLHEMFQGAAIRTDLIVAGNVATPDDSSIGSQTINSYGGTTFDGSFTIDETGFFSGEWTGASSATGGSLDFSPTTDPPGTWAAVGSAPDATSTLGLLAEVVGVGFLMRRKFSR